MGHATPWVVKALGSSVKSWSNTGTDEISIELKDFNISNVVVRSTPTMMGFAPKTELISFTSIVSEHEMRRKHRKLYQELKNLEFEMGWKGFLWKRAIFEPYFEIPRLRKFLPGLEPKSDLIDGLKRNKVLMDLIYKTRPDEICFALQSLNPSDLQLVNSAEELLKRKADFYMNPSNIVLIITVSKMFYTKVFLGQKKTYESLVRILDQVSKMIVEIIQRIQKV